MGNHINVSDALHIEHSLGPLTPLWGNEGYRNKEVTKGTFGTFEGRSSTAGAARLFRGALGMVAETLWQGITAATTQKLRQSLPLAVLANGQQMRHTLHHLHQRTTASRGWE
eukprot:654215-Amphidinium_carterae.1